MDAITYFFFNLGLHNILLALAAFLLGLLLGWLLWGKFKSQINSYINKQKEYESEINGLKSQKKDLETRLANMDDIDAVKAELETSNKAGMKLETDLKGSNQQIADLKTQIEGFKASSAASSQTDEELAACKKKCAELDTNLEGSNQQILDLKNQLQECQASLSSGNQADEELAACKRKCAELEAERGGLESKIATLSASAVSNPVEPVVNETASKSRAFFASALESGKMKEDEQYGLLYTSAPDEVDDLTRIKGVAGVLNGTLNEYGVYTYRQIALWTPQICEDFSDRLSFKGRIERDDWIGQCKEFHKEKYGEVI